MGYVANVDEDTAVLAGDADAEISAITGGAANQTVSLRTALAAQKGNKFAIAFCAFLSVMVQKDHCKICLAGGNIPALDMWRAAVCFGAAGAAIAFGIHWLLGLA